MSEPGTSEGDVPSREGGVPSAQVPGATVEPHQHLPTEPGDAEPYVDGNLTVRGDVRSGRPQGDPTRDEDSLDDDLDTTLRTDGRGTAAREQDHDD